MNSLHIYCDQFDFSAVEKAFKGEYLSNVPLSAEIIFVSADEIKQLNAKHRGKDAVTDVLSFPNLSGIFRKEIRKEDFPYDLDEEEHLFLGSVVICRKRAEEQAEEYGHSLKRELYYLAVHGLCHLLGYDHENGADKSAMREAEESALAEMGIGREEQ